MFSVWNTLGCFEKSHASLAASEKKALRRFFTLLLFTDFCDTYFTDFWEKH
jgi:hypothetical protein